MLVVWMIAHCLGFGAVSYYSDRPLILRRAFGKIGTERERRDVLRRTFRLFSGICGVSSVLVDLLDGRDVDDTLFTFRQRPSLIFDLENAPHTLYGALVRADVSLDVEAKEGANEFA